MISSETYKVEYAGNGVTTTFAVPFTFSSNSDLRVATRDSDGNAAELTTGFTVTGAGTADGEVAFTNAPIAGLTVVIAQAAQMVQETDYVENDPFPAETHEAALDKVTHVTHRLAEEISRALKVPFGDGNAGTDMTIPGVSIRAGKFLRFDDDGAPEMAELTDDVQALSSSIIVPLAKPQTLDEVAASVTPTNFLYDELDVRRYGAVGDYDAGSETDGQAATSATDNLAALNKAVLVVAQKGGGTILIDGGDFYVANSLDARGISNLHICITPGTTLRATKYTNLGGLIVMGGTGPIAASITNLRVYGGGVLRTFRPDHATVPAHQTSHAYSVGDYVLSTDSNGKTRAYYCKTAGTSGGSSPPDVINGSDTDGTVVWQDADNDNVIGINGDGIVVEGLEMPSAAGKFVTCQVPNSTNVRISNLRCGTSNDKGVEVKGQQGLTGQEAAFCDGITIENVVIEAAGYEGVEVEQGSFSSALNKNARIVGVLVRSAGLIDTTAAGIRVNRCENVEIRAKVLDSGGNGFHVRQCKNVTGDLHSESAGIFGVHLQENTGWSFGSIYVKNSTDSGVKEADDKAGGFVGRLNIDTAANGWEVTSRDGDAPVIATYKMSTIAGANFLGDLPTLMDTVPSAKQQSFTLDLFTDNADSDTIKHRIVDDILNASAASFADRITGASATFTATPTGTDASTAFAGGGKISAANPSEFILNHANAAVSAHGVKSAVIVRNSSTVALTVGLVRRSVDVNGATLTRWHLQFRNATSGAVYDLTTLGSGLSISVQVVMYLP